MDAVVPLCIRPAVETLVEASVCGAGVKGKKHIVWHTDFGPWGRFVVDDFYDIFPYLNLFVWYVIACLYVCLCCIGSGARWLNR